MLIINARLLRLTCASLETWRNAAGHTSAMRDSVRTPRAVASILISTRRRAAICSQQVLPQTFACNRNISDFKPGRS